MHIGSNIVAMQIKTFTFRQAQHGMQHRAVFGEIDRFATQHRITPRFDILLPRQCQQIQFCRGIDALFRIVEQNAAGGSGKMAEALRISAEQFFQAGQIRCALLQQTPDRCAGNRSGHERAFLP